MWIYSISTLYNVQVRCRYICEQKNEGSIKKYLIALIIDYPSTDRNLDLRVLMFKKMYYVLLDLKYTQLKLETTILVGILEIGVCPCKFKEYW